MKSRLSWLLVVLAFPPAGSVFGGGRDLPPGPWFTNVTDAAGLTGAHGFRCSVADIDGDGYPDLVLHRQSIFETGDVRDKQYVFVNRPCEADPDPHCRRYLDVTAASGVRATRAGAPSGHQSDGVVFADVDNDGDLDAFFFVYVHQNWTLTGRNDLMLNDGQGHFTYAPASTFHQEPVYNTTDGVWLDYDNDGNIDLAIGNWYWNNQPTTEQLYRGHGDGSFTNVTTSSGIGSAINVVYALSTFDWNNDGFMDLFAPAYDYLNPSIWCLHWRNNGNGTFTQVQSQTQFSLNCGWFSGVACFGTMARDYDNDGQVDFWDIFVHGGSDRGKYSGPVRNVAGVFSWDWTRVQDRGTEDPNTKHDGDHEGSWLDFDGDGRADFVMTESFYDNNRLYLFHQDADGKFRPVTIASGLDAINAMNQAAYDVIPLDYDRDGDEDLLVGFADDINGVQLWRNDLGNTSGWLSITLEGGGTPGHANRAGIGARIEVTSGGVTQTREVYAGPGQHAPQAPLTQVFGLGAAAVVDRIRVRWPNPSLSVTELTNVAANRFLTIREVCDLPADPTGLTVTKDAVDLHLAWDDPAAPGLAWNVYRDSRPDPSLWGAPHAAGVSDEDPATPGIQYRDAGAVAGTAPFFYLVAAVGECGESPWP